MAAIPLVKIEDLRQQLTYDPETGLIRRNDGKFPFCFKNGSGYLCGSVNRRMLLAHRVAWALHYGEWPDSVDHLNGDKLDNRVANMRSVSHATNNRNRKKPTTNKSGVIGVSWDSQRNKWLASIMVDRKTINLGRFDDKEEAIAARKKAESAFGFHHNHGR